MRMLYKTHLERSPARSDEANTAVTGREDQTSRAFRNNEIGKYYYDVVSSLFARPGRIEFQRFLFRPSASFFSADFPRRKIWTRTVDDMTAVAVRNRHETLHSRSSASTVTPLLLLYYLYNNIYIYISTLYDIISFSGFLSKCQRKTFENRPSVTFIFLRIYTINSVMHR